MSHRVVSLRGSKIATLNSVEGIRMTRRDVLIRDFDNPNNILLPLHKIGGICIRGRFVIDRR